MPKIHPSSLVHPNAKIDDSVEIGPFCIVEEYVKIGKGTKLNNHVVIYNNTTIGENNIFHQGCSIGNVPQDLKFNNEFTEVIIGNNNTFREYFTVHRGTSATKKTIIGNNCFLMAYAHVAHDCVLADNVIMANSVNLGGHVHIDDFVIIGGVTGIHQFVKIGQHSMIGGTCGAGQDILPYGIYGGRPLKCSGINLIGLKRRGFSSDTIDNIRKAFNIILSKTYNTKQAVQKIKEEIPMIKEIKVLIDFIESSERGIAK